MPRLTHTDYFSFAVKYFKPSFDVQLKMENVFSAQLPVHMITWRLRSCPDDRPAGLYLSHF